MKKILQKQLKVVLILVLTIISTYLVLTIKDFSLWCERMQVNFKSSPQEQLANLDIQEIQNLGNAIENFSKSVNENFKGTEYEQYNALGITIWYLIQTQLTNILNYNIISSITFGIIVTMGYIVITNKVMSNSLKFIIGYVTIILIVPPIYMYAITGRCWDLITMYSGIPKLFYIMYTLIFIIIFIVNYRIGLNLTNILNENIKKDKQ